MSDSEKDVPKIDLYHHTTREAAQKIYETGHIKQSTDTTQDAVYGRGTYLTSYDADASKTTVLYNNYDYESDDNASKADAVVHCRLDSDKVEKVPEPNRDIYVHKGDISKENIVGIYDRKTGVTLDPNL